MRRCEGTKLNTDQTPRRKKNRDLATATTLAQYKGNHSASNGFCMLGADYIASSQANKDAVHFYAFHKVRERGCRRRQRRRQERQQRQLRCRRRGGRRRRINPLPPVYQQKTQCFVAARQLHPMARAHWDTLREHTQR